MRQMFLLVFAQFILLTSFAHAETLAEKKKWVLQEEALASEISSFERKCGFKPTISFDKASFAKDWPADQSIGSSCGPALDASGSICEESADGKAAITKNVRKVICKFSGKGKSGGEHSGTTLVWSGDPFVATAISTKALKAKLESKF
ncbi:MAG TPA: hypothetical protein VNJ01_15200 [Bacteriovoracaceae bacterium]|nr:hypothetical protein [Bacteriovoracaceae bacterium]